MINLKVSTFLAVLAILGLFQLSYFQPQFFYWNLILMNLVLIAALRNLPTLNFSSGRYWNFLILPFLFLNSSLVNLALTTEKLLTQFLIVFSVIFAYYYIYQIYSYLRNNSQVNNLINISSSGVVLTIFFAASSLYGLRATLHSPIWLLILVLLAVLSLMTYHSLWMNSIDLRLNFFYVLVIDLLIIELGWALFFLSFTYHILGIILTICYYIIIGLTKFNLKGSLDRRRLKFYLGLGFTGIFLTLLTARIL